MSILRDNLPSSVLFLTIPQISNSNSMLLRTYRLWQILGKWNWGVLQCHHPTKVQHPHLLHSHYEWFLSDRTAVSMPSFWHSTCKQAVAKNTYIVSDLWWHVVCPHPTTPIPCFINDLPLAIPSFPSEFSQEINWAESTASLYTWSSISLETGPARLLPITHQGLFTQRAEGWGEGARALTSTCCKDTHASRYLYLLHSPLRIHGMTC
jgi:hypothetical protein